MNYCKSLHSTKQLKSDSNTKVVLPPSSGMLNIIKEGFGFGIGSSVANNVVTRIFNSSSAKTTQDTMCISKLHCDIKLKEYEKCITENQDNCKELIKEYEKCVKSNTL